jgi:fumarate reductase subunit D
MKGQIPLVLVFVFGLLLAIQYFIPSEASQRGYEFVLNWITIIGIFAMVLGIWSQVHVGYNKIRRRAEDWQYSVVTLVSMFAMILFGLSFFGGLRGTTFRLLYTNIFIPIQATIFALLAFYIASASYRAFRARSAVSTVLLIAALLLMLRVVPTGPLADPINQIGSWMLLVPNLAAKRAILIGVGLGGVATALKIVLGIERSYLGKD